MAIYKRASLGISESTAILNTDSVITDGKDVGLGDDDSNETYLKVYSSDSTKSPNDIRLHLGTEVNDDALMFIDNVGDEDPMINGAVWSDDGQVKICSGEIATFGYDYRMLKTSNKDIIEVDDLNKNSNFENGLDGYRFDDGCTGSILYYEGKKVLKLTFTDVNAKCRFNISEIFPYNDIDVITSIYVKTGSISLNNSDSDFDRSSILYIGSNDGFNTYNKKIYSRVNKVNAELYLGITNVDTVVYIEYINVKKVPIIKNNRYLRNHGSNNRGYHSKVKAGTGLMFNGSDIDINCGTVVKNNQGSILLNINVISSGYIISNWDDNRLYIAMNHGEIMLGLASTAWIHTGVFLEGYIDQGTICMTYENGTWNLYVDGELKASGTYDGVVETEDGIDMRIGSKTDTDNYIYSYMNDLIIFDTVLSSEEVKNHFKEPEKFLYYRKVYDEETDTYIGIPESKFLSRDKLDSIIMYLPMNEGRYNIRDMANYVEGPNLVNDLTYGSVVSGDGNEITFEGNTITIHGETAPDEDSDGLLAKVFLDSSTVNKLYAIEFTIDALKETTTLNSCIGEFTNLPTNFILREEIYDIQILDTFNIADNSLVFRFDPNVPDRYYDFDIKITIKSVREIYNVKHVNNYRFSYSATSIPYGRQDIYNSLPVNRIDEEVSFKRLSLGPKVYSFSNDITDTELFSNKGFVIDYLIDGRRLGETSNIFVSANGTEGILLVMSKRWSYESTLYIYGNGERYTLNFYLRDNLPHHIVFVVKSDTMELYVDGTLYSSSKHTLVPSGKPLSIPTYLMPSGMMNRFRLIYGKDYDNFDLEACFKSGRKSLALLTDGYIPKTLTEEIDYDFGVIDDVEIIDSLDLDFGEF